jgi:hypothetical protein
MRQPQTSGSPHVPVPGTSATVFGLDVSADTPLPFLEAARAARTGRELKISIRDVPPDLLARPGTGTLICDEREPDGAVHLRIESDPAWGYLIWGPTYGRNLLSSDGRHVCCSADGCAKDAQQRLLIAQVLPFAALLQGLEVLHASAVVGSAGAIALVGPSRAGKTSVALELCRSGASFLTDDVLSLERAGDQLVGHPGTPLAGLDRAEERRLEQAGRRPAGDVVATNSRERLVRMPGGTAPAPLAALFFLDRRPEAPGQPSFERVEDPRRLLAATFNSVLTGPERLRGLLEVCAILARRRVERVVAGPHVDAGELAVAIERRLGA